MVGISPEGPSASPRKLQDSPGISEFLLLTPWLSAVSLLG